MENNPPRTPEELGNTDLSLPAILMQHAGNDVTPPVADPSAHLYTHVFRRGVKATAILSLNPPSLEVQWQGRPTRKLFPEYRAWRRTILEDVFKSTGVRIAVVDLR